MTEPSDTPEQQARDMLSMLGIDDAQSWSAGELVVLANYIADRDRLAAEVAQYKRDAERYRWLRSEHTIINPMACVCWKRNFDREELDWVNTVNGESLDKAIDAALAQVKEPRG